MKVQDLYIYPVKSLGGIRLDEALALQKGFEFDRRWMLVDESGKFISQRTEHRLSLLQTSINGDSITIQHKQNPEISISVPFQQSSIGCMVVSVWDDSLKLNCKIAGTVG